MQDKEQNELLSVKNVLTIADVVALTGYTKSYVYKLTSQRKIPHFKPNYGRRVFFHRSELESWLCAHKVLTRQEIMG